MDRYLDSISSLTFNTIKTKLKLHADHSSRYLKLKFMFYLKHAAIIKIQYSSKWLNPIY